MNTGKNNWIEVDYFDDGRDQKALFKNFVFKNFSDALEFTNKVGVEAEKVNHHPNINLGWGYVGIWLTTHDAHGITDKDRNLAVSIDQILE